MCDDHYTGKGRRHAKVRNHDTPQLRRLENLDRNRAPKGAKLQQRLHGVGLRARPVLTEEANQVARNGLKINAGDGGGQRVGMQEPEHRSLSHTHRLVFAQKSMPLGGLGTLDGWALYPLSRLRCRRAKR
jgi:hypothetical protein